MTRRWMLGVGFAYVEDFFWMIFFLIKVDVVAKPSQFFFVFVYKLRLFRGTKKSKVQIIHLLTFLIFFSSKDNLF